MNIEQLRHLVSLYQTRSIARSAEGLFITPQAISKSIKMLERELGVVLIKKEQGQVSLTEVGKHICEDASQVISIVDEIPLKIRAFSHEPSLPKELRLGISRFALRGTALTSRELEQLSAGVSPSTITPYYSSPEGCFLAVKRASIDAALVFGTYEYDGIASIPLGQTQLYVAVTKASPLFAHGHLELTDISGQPFLCPLDINYFYPKLLSLCNLRNINPPLFLHQSLELDMKEDFLNKGVALFVDATSNIKEYISDCKTIPLSRETKLGIPLTLIYRSEVEAPWRYELARQLSICLDERLLKDTDEDELPSCWRY